MTGLHIDATGGVAGDMLLAALLDAGADEGSVRRALSRVLPGAVLEITEVRRCGLRARAVSMPDLGDSPHRRWADLRVSLADAGLEGPVRDLALAVFGRLAVAEGAVHGTPPDDVHFHEVGAWDSICDVVSVAAAIVSLSPRTVTCSTVATGTGHVTTEHGRMPVPPPAVAEILARAGAPVTPGPAPFEACTPTGAALVAELSDRWSAGPTMRVQRVGVGAGTADPADFPNVTRVFVGVDSAEPSGPAAVVLSTNVDDLDPRVWPEVISGLLAAGASDAWLTPIHMKKGRPALTLDVLCTSARRDDVAGEVMRLTSAIGMRVIPVGKLAADRSQRSVSVLGHDIGVKVAAWRGRVVNVQPEWEDVATAARATGTPAKEVLALAVAAAASLWPNASNC